MVELNTGEFLMETCLSAKDSRLGQRFTYHQGRHLPQYTAKATLEGETFKEWPNQSLDLKTSENLWHDLKIAAHQLNQSKMNCSCNCSKCGSTKHRPWASKIIFF